LSSPCCSHGHGVQLEVQLQVTVPDTTDTVTALALLALAVPVPVPVPPPPGRHGDCHWQWQVNHGSMWCRLQVERDTVTDINGTDKLEACVTSSCTVTGCNQCVRQWPGDYTTVTTTSTIYPSPFPPPLAVPGRPHPRARSNGPGSTVNLKPQAEPLTGNQVVIHVLFLSATI
jgi:hypothetical protein